MSWNELYYYRCYLGRTSNFIPKPAQTSQGQKGKENMQIMQVLCGLMKNNSLLRVVKHFLESRRPNRRRRK